MRRVSSTNNLLALLVTTILLFSLAIPAHGAVTGDPGQIMFVLDSPCSEDIIADKTVTIRRNGNGQGNDSNSPAYFWATDLTDSHNNTITADKLYALTPYDSAWQNLDNAVLFLADNEAAAEIRFKLAKEAWGYKGVYKGWLRSSEGRDRDIRVVVHIKAHLSIILDGEDFLVTAEAPGMHEAESPVTLTVNANHDNWQITVGIDDALVYTGDIQGDNPQIDPENLFLAIGNKDFVPLTQTQIISGSKLGRSISVELKLRARTEWKHIAGTYSGKISLIVSESCDNEESLFEEQFFGGWW